MLAGMTQEETNERNRKHCKNIADRLELIAYGQLYRCPECGEWFDIEDYTENDELYDNVTNYIEHECPLCGETTEFEQVSIYDWLEDALDIYYTLNSNLEYYAGRVMVTCGGPNIYVDTLHGSVELFWWTDRASYELSNAAATALDECLEELYETRKK